MTPTKTSKISSAFGAGANKMTTDSDWSPPQRDTPEVDDDVVLLSSLLLSLILKLEDREYRVKEYHPARLGTPSSADESSDRSGQKRFDDCDNAKALVTREDSTEWGYSTDSNTEDTERVDDDDRRDTITELRSELSQVPGEPTHPNNNQITRRDDARSDASKDPLPPSSHTFEDDVTPTSLCKQGQGSVYRDSAVHIVGDAMLRAIANIFTNGVIRRGIRTYGITVWTLADYQRTNTTTSRGYTGQSLVPISEGTRQIRPKLDLVSSEWLFEVNRRIAAPEITNESPLDSMPPSVASSCNVSRCSSVDILSCGDRALKVKAIPPSQSRLLWKMVQKSQGGNNKKNPADEPDLPAYVPVNDGSAKEKKAELSKALERVRKSTPRKRFWGEKSTDVETIEDGTCLEVDRLVKFRDSAAQTEKKDFQKVDKSTRCDDVNDTKQQIREAKPPELSKALEKVRESTPQKRFWDEKSTDVETIEDGTCLELDRMVKFRDSAAQTEKKDFKKDDKSTRDDDVNYTKQQIREAKPPELSKALETVRESTPQKRFWDEKSTDVETIEEGTFLEVDQLVKFRDSTAQTEKKDFKKDDESTRDDDVGDIKPPELSMALERVRESTDVETIEEGTCLEVDQLVKFRDSTAQTEKKDFKKDDKSTRDDGVVDTKQQIREAKPPPCSVQTDERVTTEVSTAQTNQEPASQVKQLNVPPIASPLLMDVVWRYASDNDLTNHQEKRNFKAYFTRGGVRETEQAKEVVESVVHRAVSEVLVDMVISDSLESLISSSELRITPSFQKAAADLAQGPPLQFEWFPYLEGSAGPCKVTDRRRQRAERIGEVKIQPHIMRSSESLEVYEDAREKFGSSDDLLTDFLRGKVNSSEEEFTDAVCESDCAECRVDAKKLTTTDRATQVSHTAYGKDSSGSPSDDIEDEPKSPDVQLELPMESINYIKDQFEDVKVLVAKYRELLYEPLDESAPVESQQQPQTNPDEGRTSDSREVSTWQNEPGLDETDEDDGDVAARRPKRKRTHVEKDMTKAEGKSTKIEKQPEKLTKGEAQADEEKRGGKKEKTGKGKKESFPAERKAALANQDVFNKDEDNAASTHKQQVADRPPNVKDKVKRKKRDASPTRDKTSVRRTLKKTGEKMRTPIGRQKFGKTVLEKTTRDGFLSLGAKAEPGSSLESEKKKGTTVSLKGGTIPSSKTEEKTTTPSKPTDEDKPKVKNRISFFEKFSKHSLKRNDQTGPSSNSPSPEPDTPVKRASHNVEKSERLPHSESTKQKGTRQSDDMDHKGKDLSETDEQVKPESCVDSTPGKGIWTNRAFFEALGESDDQTVQTSEPPKKANGVLEDGLPDESRIEGDSQPGPSSKTKGEISRRGRSPTSPEKTDKKRKSSPSRGKKRSRNKNTNNEAPMDQVTTDESCISSSQSSCTDAAVGANGKVGVDRLLSSKVTNCDDTITEAKNTDTSRDSRSDEVERTVRTTEMIPKLSSGSLNIDEAEPTENRRVSSSPCSDSKIENEEDAVLLNDFIPHQRHSFERVNSDEATTTEIRCVSSSPSSDTKIEKEEEAFLSHNVTPQLSSEGLNIDKAMISKSPSNHIEMENEGYHSTSNDIIFDHKPSSESLPHIDGPSGGHSHFNIYHDQDETNTVNMKETVLKNSQSTGSVTEYEPLTTEIKKEYDIATDPDDGSVVLQTQNHHTHIGQAISGELTEEESKVTSVDDSQADLSLFDDLSREVQIHSPPPTGELDDVSSLNNLDVPLLTSSPHPQRHLKKSNTSSVESIEKGGKPDQTPSILRNNRDDNDDGNEDSGDDFLHHLRNTSFLLACSPECLVSKDQPVREDVQTNEDVNDGEPLKEEQENGTSNGPMKSPQSPSVIKQDGVSVFKVTAQPTSELCSNVRQARTSDGKEQEARSKVKSSKLESERRTSSEKKSCLRFSLFRKSKKRSRSKNKSPGQSEGKHQTQDVDCVPPDETHTDSEVKEKEDAVAMVTKECTAEGVDTPTDSNPTPPGSHKRKFRLKYLRESKKHKASSKT